MRTLRHLLGFLGAAALTVALQAGDVAWTTDYDAALARAAKENKRVLLDFTGSDWCGFCIQLENEVLSKPQFVEFSAKHLVLVKVDFPREKKLPATEATQNARLGRRFKVEGYPTVVVLNAKGEKLGQIVGYRPGSGVIAYLEELKKQAKL
ncbi:MAG: hypothetical protein A3G75_04145 [Verrucomicrobia bacterium RIFCSPLOWO2_12_FULL_64_8]|nr:MAG: hypothetical protein A3G75_04145 [Verrucomicrobia bacterium RIFCSPLOWO2_12_FULL_64_8]